MKNILLTVSAILLFIGCGDSSSNNTFEGAIQTSEVYTIFPGDRVIKDSESAIISIHHKDGEAESTIVLLEGNVTIIRKAE
ncbi:hypothetical protein MNB_SV-13-2132 [hydrothermal vent metagenome]|uniref:Uncharacterized protein n=1 Tax=hydrothermal vent metagenome TaxID=652676 RepID=A0A1W1C6D7_9ZZZZ